MATDFETLIPTSVAGELIAAAQAESVAMRLGNVQRMPTGIEAVRVVSVEPDAEWASRATAAVRGDDDRMDGRTARSRRLACVLAIPSAWVDDAGFPSGNRFATEFGCVRERIDETLLFAVAPVPALFPATASSASRARP